MEHISENRPPSARRFHAPLRAITLWMLCLCGSVAALDDLEETILKLSDPDFDLREEATEKLGACPSGYERVFLKLSDAVKSDPEIKTRLVEAARRVFQRSIGAKDERWLRFHADLGMAYQMHYTYEFDPNSSRPREAMGLAVSAVDNDGPSGSAVQTWDLITEIDGKDIRRNDIDQQLRAGQEHELTLRRYKAIDAIKERGAINPDDSGYTVLKVKVRAAWKNRGNVDECEAQALMAALWNEFLKDYNDPASQNFASLK